MRLCVIARIHSDFPTKFGIPRQSGLSGTLTSKIVFEPEFRSPEALRGLDGFSHLWLLWHFSAVRPTWSPTVRPPRLGGNRRVGVFATRSPFRPNPIGLSSVRLERVESGGREGPALIVSGADLMDGTPIFDIKPYLSFTDSHPDASCGFASPAEGVLRVSFPDGLLGLIPPEKREGLLCVLAQDPRPAYQDDPARVYGFAFAGFDIRFTVSDGVLLVRSVIPAGR